MREFIHCQRDIPREKWRYGTRSSAAAGCGWIAVYNALILLGIDPDPEELIRFFLRRLPLIHGTFGTSPLAPAAWFKKKGFAVSHTCRRKKTDLLAKSSDVTLLYYWWRDGWQFGAHFITVRFDGENFIGYNVYANSKEPSVLGPSLESFLKKGKRFFPVAIGVNRK
ncbi:MAG: hypothetical protein IJD13_07845 [Oscillospiraceae bacterium]|nr:hypothetical protein [Oscillospiraceae bacterium]